MSDFAGNSVKLAIESIRNSYLRQHYTELARTTSESIFEESKNAELLSPCQRLDVWKGAARKASKQRNIYMEETRKQMSPTALAFSKLIKNKAPRFSEIVEKYSYRLHGNYEDPESFPCVTEASQIRVYQTIVQASGRTNGKINIVSKVTRYFGAVSLIVTFGFIFYGIGSSKTPFIYVANCLITFKAGLAGAYLGSKLGSSTGCYLQMKHIYTFILSIVGGLCVGVASAVLCDVVVTGVYQHIHPGSNTCCFS